MSSHNRALQLPVWSFKFWLACALMTLLGGCVGHGDACVLVDPLAPVGWAWSGIKTAASGVKTAVVGTAKLTRGAYRLANPTKTPPGASPTASEPPKSGYAPQGCYHDNQDKIDRGLYFIGGDGRRMNKDKCSSKCTIFATKYFAIRTDPADKKILQCFCSNNFGLIGQGTEYDCDNRCPGEEDQTAEPCGGDGFMSVYKMKI
ncbi:hypothetical protein BOX15_Mlig034169g3 [Macrostomum lignano]|uniref:Uncharacterized protein n=2 Tax=Macrostomum lignano TaxID=282301 RepID=A0A267G029_9PLAT|nr:hypothetical protein BOX15_Mlig034169g3 [Macrostomum lignano]